MLAQQTLALFLHKYRTLSLDASLLAQECEFFLTLGVVLCAALLCV